MKYIRPVATSDPINESFVNFIIVGKNNVLMAMFMTICMMNLVFKLDLIRFTQMRNIEKIRYISPHIGLAYWAFQLDVISIFT